ncbi:MAG: hypothetical protein K2K81_07890 [Muribaculaceae bacterium]|nr:hypothetical protein [Muribaculaceae bacterium]
MEYPYYVIPDIEALPAAAGEERLRLARRIAVLVGDQTALREILGIDPAEFAEFYPDMMKPDLSTADTIDSFLDKYGDPMASHSKEVKNVEELVPLPPADYDLSAIEGDPLLTDDAPADTDDETSALLNSFLTSPAEKPKETPQLSESLARAMIKNGNYRKALEIITDLSLKNPKKSIYFADQIRFLKKLILNQSKSQKQ